MVASLLWWSALASSERGGGGASRLWCIHPALKEVERSLSSLWVDLWPLLWFCDCRMWTRVGNTNGIWDGSSRGANSQRVHSGSYASVGALGGPAPAGSLWVREYCSAVWWLPPVLRFPGSRLKGGYLGADAGLLWEGMRASPSSGKGARSSAVQ